MYPSQRGTSDFSGFRCEPKQGNTSAAVAEADASRLWIGPSRIAQDFDGKGLAIRFNRNFAAGPIKRV
jgi:hypothetical protein